MKKRIVLESPIVLPFEQSGLEQAAELETRNSHPARNYRLDRPPDGDTLLKAFVIKTAYLLSRCRPSHSERILVVEDEADLRQIYSEALLRSGYHVDTAEEGEAAWEMLHAARLDSNSYDLLITDNKMPRLSGVELIKKLRSAHMELPVILASGQIPENADWLHLAAILPKPFSQDELTQTVGTVLHVVRDEQKEI